MWTTIEYEISCVYVRQCPGISRPVWFLDAIQVDVDERRRSSSNIVNGSEDYCRKTLAQLISDIYDAGYIASEQAEPKESCPYPAKSATARAWQAGWEQALTDLCGPVLKAEAK